MELCAITLKPDLLFPTHYHLAWRQQSALCHTSSESGTANALVSSQPSGLPDWSTLSLPSSDSVSFSSYHQSREHLLSIFFIKVLILSLSLTQLLIMLIIM